MWLGSAVARGLFLVFLTIVDRNTVTAEAEQTTSLTNISPTVVTKPLANVSLQSSVNPKIQPNIQLLEIRNTSYSNNTLATDSNSMISKEIKEIMVKSTALLDATKVITPQARSRRGETSTRISSNAKPASSFVYHVQSSTDFNILKVTMISSIAVQASTSSEQETSPTLNPPKRNENGTLVMVPQNNYVSMVSVSPVQQKQQTVSSNTTHKSKVAIPVTSSKSEQSPVTLVAVHGKTNITDENKTITVSTPLEKSKIMMITTTAVAVKQSLSNSIAVEIHPNSRKSQLINITASTATEMSRSIRPRVVVPKENSSIRANKSYTKTEISSSYSTNVFEKTLFKSNSTTGTSSVEVRQANNTAVLEPSPSLVIKQSRSKISIVFTSPAVNMTELLYSKMSKGRIDPPENDTMVQHSITESALFVYNYTSKINTNEEKRLGKTINLENVTTSSPVVKLDNKTLIPTSVRYISSSERYVPSGIPAITNHTTMTSNISISGQFSEVSSNQTHAADNFTTFRVIRPSAGLPSSYKTVTNRAEEYQVSSSITMAKKTEASYTMLSRGSTYSMRNGTIEEIKPTSTALFASSTIQYRAQVSTTPATSPPKLVAQQFSVTIKITSEEFKDEYQTSPKAIREKSSEITKQFDLVFEGMDGYLSAQVLRFFSGSLGCDIVIRTVSVQSKPVTIQKVKSTLMKAKRTEGGFGKFVVGDIDVEEKNPDVQGRDEDKNGKETWGRMPIIVISILAGLCLVLFVMVITQCVSKITLRKLQIDRYETT